MNVDGYEKIPETDAMYNSRLMKAKLAQTGLYCTLEWVEAFMDWCQEEPGLDTRNLLYKMQEE